MRLSPFLTKPSTFAFRSGRSNRIHGLILAIECLFLLYEQEVFSRVIKLGFTVPARRYNQNRLPLGLPEHGLGHARIVLSVEVPREAVNGADFQATGFIVLELIAPARFTVLVGSRKTIARGYEAGRIPEPRWKER